MQQLKFHLFGSFQAYQTDGHSIEFINGKPEELFCFVLLHQQMMIAREQLAALLWGNTSTTQSKKYLRDALWKLQEQLSLTQKEPPILLASTESICLNPQADVWVDVLEFESAFSAAEKVPGAQLTPEQAQSVCHAVELYRGDLLANWYQDWCLCERVRFQDMYLMMLHKLMLWFETQHRYEEGLHYGELILRIDHAHERAHQAMMRLRYLANDRTGALRQYERLTSALATDLGVKPSYRSVQLYEQIRADQASSLTVTPVSNPSVIEFSNNHVPELLNQCKHILTTLKNLEQQLQREVEIIELNLKAKE